MSTPLPIEGEKVSLRPFVTDELNVLWARRVATAASWMIGPNSYERLKSRVQNSGRFTDGWLFLAVDADEQLVGEVEARHIDRSMPPGVFELGIEMYDESDRGRGFGSETIALFTSYLFDDYRAERVCGSTSIENASMRRVFETCGYALEGIMRAFMPSTKGRDDYALYAITKREWAELPH